MSIQKWEENQKKRISKKKNKYWCQATERPGKRKTTVDDWI